jgi:hypothetical protein
MFPFVGASISNHSPPPYDKAPSSQPGISPLLTPFQLLFAGESLVDIDFFVRRYFLRRVCVRSGRGGGGDAAVRVLRCGVWVSWAGWIERMERVLEICFVGF